MLLFIKTAELCEVFILIVFLVYPVLFYSVIAMQCENAFAVNGGYSRCNLFQNIKDMEKGRGEPWYVKKSMETLNLRMNLDCTKWIILIKQVVKGRCRNELHFNGKNSRRKKCPYI